MVYAPMAWMHKRPHGRLLATGDEYRIGKALRHIRTSGPFATQNALVIYGALEDGLDPTPYMSGMAPESETWHAMLGDGVLNLMRAGRNVFHLDREMTDNIRQIELDEVTTEDLVHPYDAYYLVLDGEAMPLASGHVAEGVIIDILPWSPDPDAFDRVERELRAQASRERLDPNRLDHSARITEIHNALFAKHMPGKVLDITFVPMPEPGPWHENREIGFKAQVVLKPGETLIQSLLRNAADLEGSFGKRVIDQPPVGLEKHLRLVLNAILYITRYAGDRPLAWQPDAPTEIVDQALKGRKSAQRQLARDGYVMTRLIRFRDDVDPEDGIVGDRKVAPHWRRAHWRRQPYGPASSLRKLILVRQSRVGFSIDNQADVMPETRVYR